MPRRNHSLQPRTRRVPRGELWEMTMPETFEDMAFDLVRRGLATTNILESTKNVRRTETQVPA